MWPNVSSLRPASHLFIQRVEENSRLDRLSQTHLISQDGVGALSPGEPQPVKTLQLVWVQRPPGAVQVVWLTIKFNGRLQPEVRKRFRTRVRVTQNSFSEIVEKTALKKRREVSASSSICSLTSTTGFSGGLSGRFTLPFTLSFFPGLPSSPIISSLNEHKFEAVSKPPCQSSCCRLPGLS